MIALRDYQQLAVDGLRASYRTGHRAPLLVSPTGSGKCLGRGTPVMMFDGTAKNVEDVYTGDLLMGPDSQPRRVVSVCRGRENLYRVTPKKGDAYVVNESHILSLRISGNGGTQCGGRSFPPGGIANVSVSEYLEASATFRHVAKGWRASVDFPEPQGPRPIPPYILGVWLGDGNGRLPEICNVDGEVVDAWKEYAASIGHQVVFRGSQQSPQYAILGPAGGSLGRGHCRNEVMNALRSLDLIQNKHIPHQYKTASRQDRLALLAGIIDTDGYYSAGNYDLVLKQEQFARDVVFLCRSLGLAAYVKACEKKCTNTGAVGQYWRMSISGDLTMVPCRVARRIAQPRKPQKNVLNVGLTVEPLGPGEYFGFELSGPDRLFLLGDFTVTHNTYMFSYITQGAAAKGNRVCILVHRQELLRQTSASLEAIGVQHGVICAGRGIRAGEQVQVASVQTLVRRLGRVPPPSLIIADEAHHAVAGAWGKVLAAFPAAYVLGVTATPERLDGRGLGRHCGGVFDALVHGPDVADLIRRGYLSRPVYYAPPPEMALDLSGVAMQAGDFKRRDAAARVGASRIVGDAVATYARVCPGAPAIAFCVSVAEAERTAAQFRAAGYSAASLDGTLADSERAARIRALGTGGLQVLTSCEIVSEGFDLPVVTTAILLRPTASLSLHLQQIGRVLRPHEGKDCSYVLDHVGNLLRLGLAEDEREWSLDGRRKRKREDDAAAVTSRQCPRCFAVHAPAPRCPQCGYQYTPDARELEQVDGELVELTPERIAAQRKAQRREVAKAKTMDELLQVAAMRGYKPGWAEHIMRAREARGLVAPMEG